MNTKWRWVVLCAVLISCEGISRDCSSCIASDVTGADWLAVQYACDGRPVGCWRLDGLGVTNEKASDGIYWKGSDGNLFHLSGIYNYVQVENDWEAAARSLGIRLSACRYGRYSVEGPE